MVANANLEPNWKKGYLNKLAINNAHINPKPKSAPDFVDWTKCDTPMAAPANNNPGPSFLRCY